jgi:multidrug efflux pump subunit AcrA (membrane-fusion protein)
MLLLVGSVSCRDHDAHQAEMSAFIAENIAVRNQMHHTEQELRTTRERLLVTQTALNEVESACSQIQFAHDTLQTKVQHLTRENADMRNELRQVAEQQRILAQAAGAKREQEAARKQSELTASVVVGPPPFRVYDVGFVGEMDFEGKKRRVGRFSVTNNTDTALRIFANSLFRTIRIDVAPHSSSNGIYMAAQPGDVLRVSTSNHTEVVRW